MKAVTQDTYGSADVLKHEEIEKPSITDDEVLLRVQAASVNPLDWHLMRGRPLFVRLVSGFRKPKQPVRGVDVAGRIEAVGPSVTRFQPGDEVLGWCEGAFAEYATTKEGSLVPKPADISHEEAAAVPVAGFTALQGLRDLGRIEPGHRVLIIGASGGVGTFAVQIAKSFDAEVTAVCSTGNVGMVGFNRCRSCHRLPQGRIPAHRWRQVRHRHSAAGGHRLAVDAQAIVDHRREHSC